MDMPELPDGLGDAGGELWRAVTGRFQLESHEKALLVETVRTIDHLHALDQLVRADGRVIETDQGPRAHPGLVEGRQQRIVLARLLGVLALPDVESGGKAPGRKSAGGVRGPYSIRPGA